MPGLTEAQRDELRVYEHLKAVGLFQPFQTFSGELASRLGVDERRLCAAIGRLHGANHLRFTYILRNLRPGSPGSNRLLMRSNTDLGDLRSEQFEIELTPDGMGYFERLEMESKESEGELIFISCGQYTDEEWGLGCTVERLIRERTGREAFFAQNESSLEGVSKRFRRAESRRWVRRHNASQGSRFHPRGRAYSGIRLG